MTTTVNSYALFLEEVYNSDNTEFKAQYPELLERFKNPCTEKNAFHPVSFVLDYTTGTYHHVGDSVLDMLGFRPDYLLEGGLKTYLGRWHPSDLQILSSEVFKFNLSFFSTIAPGSFADYIVSYNYRIKDALGYYKKVLQRFSFMPNGSLSQPIGVVGIAFDISHFKPDYSIVHTIERSVSTPEGPVNELVYKKIYPVADEFEKFPLSNRELEVLKYLSTGLSSKQIATLTNLSINTVNNHRKNMLKKTHSNSSSELISFAGKHGLL